MEDDQQSDEEESKEDGQHTVAGKVTRSGAIGVRLHQQPQPVKTNNNKGGHNRK
jgi:hypothetical protein